MTEFSWITRAEDALTKFLDHRRATDALSKFMAEDVREWTERHGLERPPEPRAWGSLMQRASKRGLIEPAGYDVSKNRQAHSRPTAVWRLVL